MSTYNDNGDDSPKEVYDRLKELEEFDNTKLGVKGLVDAGVTLVPRIFHHSPETLFVLQDAISNDVQNLIPVIDMSLLHQDLVQKIQEASAKFGFFQVVNHGVPVMLLERVIKASKAFHELPSEEKIQWYSRDPKKKVMLMANQDLFRSRAACWRDTLLCPLPIGLDTYIDPNVLPFVCRDEVVEYEKEVKQVGDRMLGLLSEGLGLSHSRLERLPYMGEARLAANYYPPCPEPAKTVGISSHRDLGMFTILLQDQVGGLQVKYGDKWINLKPVEGALVVNLGDTFQMVSNGEYKSGEHRAVANSSSKARASIAVFFHPGSLEHMFGPLPELVSDEKPALYKQFTFAELRGIFFNKEIVGTTTDHFRL